MTTHIALLRGINVGGHKQVAMAHLREITTEHGAELPPQALFLLGRVAERYANQAAELRKRFPAAYRPLKGRAWKDLQRAMRRGSRSVPPPARRRPVPATLSRVAG